MKKQNFLKVATSAALVMSLLACSSDDSNASYISFGVTDAPVDNATNVFVQFDSLEFKPADGDSVLIELDEVKTIDLLALQGGDFELLVDNMEVEAGEYNWVRLGVLAERGVMDSYIVLDDSTSYSLYVPSGNETGLKINRGFVVPVGGAISLMVDFDLRKSVTNPVGQVDDYKLKPVLRMTDNSETGTIQGSISNSAIFEAGDSCDEGKAAYLYTGADAVIDDIGSANEPLTTSLVEYNADSDRWEFEIGFVEAGDYSLAMTCDADLDELESDEADWSSLVVSNVSVVFGETSIIAFD
jgi:hypothetical protein